MNEKVIHAFKNCSVESFKNLLNDGFNPSSVNEKKNTIVHILCQLKLIDLDILNLFLHHPQYDPNLMNHDDHTILNILCKDTLIDNDLKYQMIINILENPRINDSSLNNGCLHDACDTENIKLVRLFLTDNRINPNKKNRIFQFPIEYVYRSYNLELLRLFCEDPRVKFLSEDDIMLTPYHGKKIDKSFTNISNFIHILVKDLNVSHDRLIYSYIRYNNVDLLKIILSFKDLIINKSKYHAFHITNCELLETLLQDGRFDSFVFETGSTFYHKIFFHRLYPDIDYEEINKLNKLCLNWNLDPRIKNSSDVTPFHLMCDTGLYQSFMDAYEKYPIDDINMCDDEGNTLLHYACETRRTNDALSNDEIHGRLQLMKFLAKHPFIDFSKVNEHGHNIFHNICLFAQIPIIKFFIEEVDLPDHIINGVNKYGQTPFYTLIHNNLSKTYYNQTIFPTIKYLLKIDRIDFSKRNENGQTPFEYIYECSNKMDPINHATKLAQYMIDNVNGIVAPNDMIIEVNKI